MQSVTRQALVAWMRQFGATMAVYLAALAGATWALTSMPMGAMRIAVILAPILPGISNVAWAIFVAQMLRLLATGA
jgi:hypothetical protein